MINSIVTNLLSNDLYARSLSTFEKIKIWCFKKKLNKWLKAYISKYEGSILTSSAFENYLTYHKPIEKMFLSISGERNASTKEEFVNTELSIFRESANSIRFLSVTDESVFKELLSGIYDRISAFYLGMLSSNQKYTIGLAANIENQLNTQIQKSEATIINKVTDKTDEINVKVDNISDYLKRIDTLSDPSVAWTVYEVLSREIMNGQIMDVVNIFPLVKNKSLEYGLDFLIRVISNDQLPDKSFEMLERVVEYDRVYADLVEKIIYILYVRNDMKMISMIGSRNVDLYDIAQCLYHNRLDVFFTLQTKRESGLFYYEYKLNENYPNHSWLVKRICMIEMLKSQVGNASEGIIQLIDSTDNIVDSILLYERRVRELLGYPKQNNSDVEIVIVALDDLLDRISNLSYYLREKYFLTCLHARLLQASEAVLTYYDLLPDDIKQNRKIIMIKIQASLNTGSVDENLLLKICIEEDEYWLLNNYLIFIINDNNNPEYAKAIIDNHRFICDKDASVFLIYVQLVAHIENKGNAVKLLKDYETRYGDRLDYWDIKLSIEYVDDELERISSRWLNDELYTPSNETSARFIRLLVKHKKFEYALQCLLRIEKVGKLSLDLMKLKALALLRTQHEIESLEIFKDIYSNGVKTEEIIYYVLALSLNNKRTVPEGIIETAKVSDNARILSLAAEYVALYASHDEACNLMKRALYRSTADDTEIFGQYIRIHKESAAAPPIETNNVDVSTAVFLTNTVDGSKKAYCVHPKGELPDDLLFWENSTHIFVETAIKIGLFKKHVGDEIDINSVVYSISRIEPLDTFLFRICMEKLVESGNAKAIKTSINGDGQLIADEFIKQVISITGDENSNLLWVEQYKNTSLMPAPLNCCFGFGKTTYTKLISLLIEDSSIVFRESLGKEDSQSKGYVLSTAAAVALLYIGFIPGSVTADLVIPSTLKRLVSEDADKAIAEYGRDTVASMGVLNGKLYFMEATEKEKNSIMSEAIKLKDYVSGVPVINNEHDLVLKYDEDFDIKKALGIADYDAISIAVKKGMTLVSAEVPVTAVCCFEGINASHCCVADFLAHTCEDWEILTEYIKRMLEYRFLIPFTFCTVKRLECAYSNGTEMEKTRIIKAWLNLLYIPIDDNNYKLQLVNYCREMLSQVMNKTDDLSPVWRCLMLATVIYSGYSIQVNVSEEGEITTDLIKDE